MAGCRNRNVYGSPFLYEIEKNAKTIKKGEIAMKTEKKHTIDRILQEKKIDMELDEAFELSNSASFTDCTGSVPTAPVTEEQWENYGESYHFKTRTVTKKKD